MPAKGTSRFIVTDEILHEVEQLASRGMSMAEIGDVLGVVGRTVYTHKNNNAQFAQAIKKGQAKGVKSIANALYENAKGGNTVAQIFFLKNRAPDTWRDRSLLEHSGLDGKPIDIKVTIKYVD